MSATVAGRARVFEALAAELAAAGVTEVFGLIGEDTAPLVAALEALDVRYIGVRHENVGVTMADGYAWASGGLGVCVVTRGPGVTNGVTAMVTAARARRNVLVICGDQLAGADVAPDLKRLDQAAIAAAAEWSYFSAAERDQVLPTLRAAMASARAGRPALLAVPLTLQLEATPADWEAPETGAEALESTPISAPLRDDELETAGRLLAAAKRPLVLAGHGATSAEARAALVALAEHCGALLGTTLKAKDLFRGVDYDAGIVGGFTPPARRPLLASLDCVVAFGASLTSYTTEDGTRFDGVAVIHCDVDPSRFGRHHRADATITGDAAQAATALRERLDAPSEGIRSAATLELLAASSDPLAGVRTDDGPGELDPRRLAARLDAVLPPERRIVCDGGAFVGFPAMYMRVPRPSHFRFTLDFAAVGMGLGTALGALVSQPELPTVLFIGDGGLSMTLGDLETVARHRLPLTIVVMNDRAYGAERHVMDRLELPHSQSLLPEIDFAAVAQSLGIDAIRLHSSADLEAASELLATAGTAPLLLDCIIRPEVRGQWMEH